MPAQRPTVHLSTWPALKTVRSSLSSSLTLTVPSVCVTLQLTHPQPPSQPSPVLRSSWSAPHTALLLWSLTHTQGAHCVCAACPVFHYPEAQCTVAVDETVLKCHAFVLYLKMFIFLIIKSYLVMTYRLSKR